jgi:hypothetical protein
MRFTNNSPNRVQAMPRVKNQTGTIQQTQNNSTQRHGGEQREYIWSFIRECKPGVWETRQNKWNNEKWSVVG